MVDGNDTLDGLSSEWLMANGSFCESCMGGKVLMEEKTVDVEVCQYTHQGVRWVKSVYLRPKGLVS